MIIMCIWSLRVGGDLGYSSLLLSDTMAMVAEFHCVSRISKLQARPGVVGMGPKP